MHMLSILYHPSQLEKKGKKKRKAQEKKIKAKNTKGKRGGGVEGCWAPWLLFVVVVTLVASRVIIRII